MSDLFGIRHALREASENILVAATHEGMMRESYMGEARDCIARGFYPEAPFGRGEDWLVDQISDIISDYQSISPVLQARHIVDELFKHLKPEDV